jgi:hypothetical protein
MPTWFTITSVMYWGSFPSRWLTLVRRDLINPANLDAFPLP